MQAPEAGKTYTSRRFKGFTILAKSIEKTPDRFYIRAIDKSQGAHDQEILVWEEEWEHAKFTPAPYHP